MNRCFADTSYFLAILIPGDTNHATACKWGSDSIVPITTTEYVLVEVANFLSPPRTRQVFARLLSTLRGDNRVDIEGASASLFDRGTALYQ